MKPCATLSLVLLLGVGVSVNHAAGSPAVFTFEEGLELTELPLHALLHPDMPTKSLDLTLALGTIQGPASADELLIDFTTPMYYSADGTLAPFAPTLRIAAGDSYTIHLRNNLTYPADSVPLLTAPHPLNGYSDPYATNIHSHGIHGPTGLYNQSMDVVYEGGDNFFYHLHARRSESEEPLQLTYSISTDVDHAPGLHWHHPHKHGSSTFQIPAANGLILVEDNSTWLPDENGCAEVRSLLESSPDYILHLGVYTFAPPQGLYNQPNKTWNSAMDDTNLQFYSETATPNNPACCDNDTLQQEGHVFAGEGTTIDFVLLNGGYKPVISLEVGRYQHWRPIHTGYKRFFDLMIIDPNTNMPTDQCELLLLSKDGVYLLEMPRAVDHIFLTSANRAELLVKCNGAPGTEYILASGNPNTPFGPGLFNSTADILTQDIATIILTEATAPADNTPDLKACKPLRAAYIADMRDEALAANNAADKVVVPFQAVGFLDNPAIPWQFGCLINGENYSYPDPGFFDLPLGSIIEYSWTNLNWHPFHLHTNPFQIVALNNSWLNPATNWTSWFEVGDFHDTLQLPQMGWGTAVPLRIQPGQNTGYSVLHCHFVQHEDMGCMKLVRYSCPGHQDPQPKVCPPSDWSWAVPGDYPAGATLEYQATA